MDWDSWKSLKYLHWLCWLLEVGCDYYLFVFSFLAKNSIKIYLNANSRSKCALSYNGKRNATFSSNVENVICYQIQPDNESQSMSDPHILSSKKLSVGLRRWVFHFIRFQINGEQFSKYSNLIIIMKPIYIFDGKGLLYYIKAFSPPAYK